MEGDAGQLVQVLINLLSNANKHTGKGRVSVRVENLGKQLRVSVADNGDGISLSFFLMYSSVSDGAGKAAQAWDSLSAEQS